MSAPAPQPQTLHALVRGRVQGVGFRFFVANRARALGLTGWVRNRPDGRVEALAQGEREALQALAAALAQGPRFSHVEAVELEWNVPAPPLTEFTIGY